MRATFILNNMFIRVFAPFNPVTKPLSRPLPALERKFFPKNKIKDMCFTAPTAQNRLNDLISGRREAA